MLKEGQKAPKLKLPTDGGGSIDLATLHGCAVVVYFYPKDDTSGCTKEAKAFTEKQKDFKALNVTVVGISPDSVRAHEKFRNKHALTIVLAADEGKAAVTAWGVWVEKSMYGRKYMGVERTTFLIDKEGKIARVWRKVKVAGHAEDVLMAARELQAAKP